MELLNKTKASGDDRRQDNADRVDLFPKENHPHAAAYYKDDWSFVTDTAIRENIAYQLQYIEFLVKLYNGYQIYLTVESLLCKTIMVTIAGIIECALFDSVEQASTKANFNIGDKRDFITLINFAYDMQYIDRDMKDAFHELRKIRNFIHLTAADFQEYKAYTVEETNHYIQILDRFHNVMAG
ncbi:MAG: hypothetical protein A3B31_01085 [Candidatus Komeilibacteria bacterium RIFCSPLOWO2_01_FULL_53_11]|uniref:DUF4145 domain-containing protein n=1 Tax=Candidatus Komeilibacteria bacterium RIFCSPLOWO2_01_FULL_53_11 TaxID=1798552 RepID=A0A1G2BPX7_9BACT|nr:MAG: hypothetical protein A3B31_01085 [Candidatus Komeilibacteria bacterium RIFCSPLOWO2_01_FULL_53_11]